MVKIKLSEEEKRYLIRELSERIKDVILMNAHKRAEEVVDIILRDIHDRDVDPHEEFTVQFNFKFLINDLIQIVGRYRRRKRVMGNG
jgi:phenylpyruvate tautomerase PptA (4-oxalocrotonate tautomerase family)